MSMILWIRAGTLSDFVAKRMVLPWVLAISQYLLQHDKFQPEAKQRKQSKHKHKHKQTWCLNQRCQGPQSWQAWADLALVCEVHCSSILVVFPQLWQCWWPWRLVMVCFVVDAARTQRPAAPHSRAGDHPLEHTHNESCEESGQEQRGGGGRRKEKGERKLFPINYDER